MAVTPSSLSSRTGFTIEPDANTLVGTLPQANSQRLRRFALVGLGPLSALGVFALVYAFVQRIAGS